MADIIHLLPDAVANQIAAGEVIQRPASVLKELVENAIDAGATSIKIEIKDAGKTLIRVADNGKGMSATDARMAFERHATSKIKQADDLLTLNTMGFRGEALPSIASVAVVELKTRRHDDELGTRLVISGSEVETQETVNCAQGATFDVKNLFFNVPARRRFLKVNTTELRNLNTEFLRIALVNPQVAFSYVVDGDEIHNLPATFTKMRIDNLFGRGRKNLMQQLLTIETDTQIVKIRGFVGKPEGAQKTANQFFFVNGRFMKHPYFHKAVITAYGNMLAQDENPHYFIYMDVDPKDIDVNIHPTKTEIKFVDEQAIWAILNASVKEALGKFNVVDAIDFNQEDAPDIPLVGADNWQNIKAPTTTINPQYNPFDKPTTYTRKSTQDWKLFYEEGNKTSGNKNDINIDIPQEEPSAEQVSTWEISPEKLALAQQLWSQYVMIPAQNGMLLVEPRRAHARILYERYLTSLKQTKGVSQQLLFPEEYVVPIEDKLYFEQIVEDLQCLGFDLEHMGDNLFRVNGIPADLQNSMPQDVLDEIVFAVKNAPTNIRESYQEITARTLANAAALKMKRALTTEEIQDLLNNLLHCKNQLYDANGRQIMIFIEKKEFDNRF